MAAAFRFFRAALAVTVLSVLLAACGGGDGPQKPQITMPAGFIAKQALPSQTLSAPVVGQSVNEKKQVLAVSSAAVPRISGSFKSAAATTSIKAAQTVALAATRPTEFTNAALIDWAEGVFPTLFPVPASIVVESILAPDGNFYYARYYELTQSWVAVCLGGGANTCVVDGAYGLGPYTGNVIQYFGLKETYKCSVNDDWCRPKVASTVPDNDATGISAKGTQFVFKFQSDTPLNCTGIGGTTELGDDIKIIASIACDSPGRQITIIPQDNRWLFGAKNCLSVSGIQNMAGYALAEPATSCFTTRAVQSPRVVYVGDLSPTDRKAVNVIDPTLGVLVKKIDFLTPISWAKNLVADPLSGQLIAIPVDNRQLYFVDLEDQTVTVASVTSDLRIFEGAFLSGNDFCSVLTRTIASVNGVNQLFVNNQLICWSRTTKRETYLGPKNSIATESLYTTRVQQVERKIYLTNATLTAWDNPAGLWLPGTPGELRVLNSETRAVERTVAVGSVPVDFAVHKTTGVVYVINGGDRSLSLVYPDNRVETYPLAGYTDRDNQRPTAILLDEDKGRFYVADGYRYVVVYDLASRAEIKRIQIAPDYGPIYLARVGDDLWVTNAYYQGGSVQVINRDLLTITRVISGMGVGPSGIAEFVPQ